MTDLESALDTASRRRVPIVAAVLMAVAILCPIVPIVMSSLGWQGDIGLGIFTQPVVGLLGAIAALFDRSIEFGARVGWAAVSMILGMVLVPVWWFLLVLLLGP